MSRWLDMSRWQLFVIGLSLLPAVAAAELQVVVIEGLGGEQRYARQFADQVAAIETAAKTLTTENRVRVFRNGEYSRDAVIEYFTELNGTLRRDDRLAVFLIGHGSYDDHEYKFNLAGPDLTDSDLVAMFDEAPAGTQLIVNTSSSSGAISDALKRDDRTLILATRSGAERHATRFGNYFAAALADAGADIDKNNIVTAAEAFRFAERRVADYYERNGQLATEHPRLEGSQAGRFGLARLGSRAPARSDTAHRRLLTRRDALNTEIEELRLRKDSMSADAYRVELLENMLELATLEEQIERREAQLTE